MELQYIVSKSLVIYLIVQMACEKWQESIPQLTTISYFYDFIITLIIIEE